jgi:hypothetical protein
MIICPEKAAIFSRIFSCKPMPVATETIIIIKPIAIAEIAILIIGADILCLLSLPDINRRAMKYSRFKIIGFMDANVKKV